MLSSRQIISVLGEAFCLVASLAGLIVVLLGELDRRQAWRGGGATSLVQWLSGRMGLSGATARAYAHVAGRLSALPALARGLSRGECSFDQVRAVAQWADPDTDSELAQAAATLSVKDLVALARSKKAPSRDAERNQFETRALRCNDATRTISAQLPLVSYVEVKSILEARAKVLGSDGETRFDQRLADAFVSLLREKGAGRSGMGALVVAHAPLESLLDPDSSLPGELEGAGLISGAALRQLACDATLIIAADDEAGHTMYEGRARRYPTPAQRREIWRRDRHCRFPGCANTLFTNAHHLRAWKPRGSEPGGPTDLFNLALLCVHHHHLIHSNAWTATGDANATLSFLGPEGVVMTTEPSPLWAQVSDPTRVAKRRARDPGG